MKFFKYVIIGILLLIGVVYLLLQTCNIPSDYPVGDFHAIVISDIHISNDETKDQRLMQLIQNINAGDFPGVKFLVANGDIVSRVFSDYTHDNPDTSDSRLKRAMVLLRQLNIPFYLVMGNHDYKIGPDRDSDGYFSENEILKMESIWKRETGFMPYYKFEFNGWRFILLNSFRGRYLNQHFDADQVGWFQEILKEKKPTILFSHFPIKTDHFKLWCKPKDLIRPENESQFMTILKENKDQIKAIFVGHGHRWVHDTLFRTIPVYETDSFGDSDGLPYHIIGFDEQTNQIQVSRSPAIQNKEVD